MSRNVWVTSLQFSLFLFFLIGDVNHAYAQSETTDPNFPAEKLIIELISKGETVDLTEYFDNEVDRVIRAEFLENLLTEKIIMLPEQGVSITNVKIAGSVALPGDVFGVVSITNCLFTGTVNLQRAKFENLSFSGCRFREEVTLQKAAIYESAYFDNVIFDKNVEFGFISIGDNLDLGHAYFGYPETTSFNGINVGKNVLLNSVKFEGPVDFSYATINEILDLRSAQLNSPREVSFNNISVGQHAFFQAASFSGPIDFGHARINGNLDFNQAQFNSLERVRFNSLQVSGSILFEDAVFSGPPFFIFSKIGGLGDFEGAQFVSPLIASFSFLNVEYGISFKDAVFSGPFSFGSIDSGGSIEFNNAKFMESESNAIVFDDINTGGSFTLTNSSFQGGVTITNVTAKNAFEAKKIEFLDPNASINMSQIDAQNLAFDMVAIKGRLSFINCSFLDFHLKGAEGRNSFLSLNISGTKIERNFFIENFTVNDFAGFGTMSYGNAGLEDIQFNESVNLEYANFNNLVFQNVLWPNAIDGSIYLNGFIYHQFIPGASLEDSNWHILLDLINIAPYNVVLYRNLESYLAEQGHPDWADQVFIAQKRRERAQLLEWTSPSWWWSFFLDGLTLYGRNPGRAFFWSALIIIIGTLTFKKEKMSRIEKGNENYSAFWYSFDLFIPVDLGVQNKWEPNQKNVTIYRRIHQILGWIVIPIALLSISGFFR